MQSQLVNLTSNKRPKIVSIDLSTLDIVWNTPVAGRQSTLERFYDTHSQNDYTYLLIGPLIADNVDRCCNKCRKPFFKKYQRVLRSSRALRGRHCCAAHLNIEDCCDQVKQDRAVVAVQQSHASGLIRDVTERK